MKKILAALTILLSCDTGELDIVADIPVLLNEVSGIEQSPNSESIWMINDSGNKPQLFLVNLEGTIEGVIDINAKNRDWEDLTLDLEGNLYIGNFGNNGNASKKLSILKIPKEELVLGKTITPKKIKFKYADQNKFPPKKKNRYFDCEAFIHFQDNLYLFTKSRVNNDFGRTNVYKIPAIAGEYEAELVGSFKTCDDLPCWITAADISENGNMLALLTLDAVWTFTEFENDDFFSGKKTRHDLEHRSQKESLCFKDSGTVYIADEYAAGTGGNLYEFKLQKN